MLTDKILDIEGVYRTRICRRQGKLSVNYQEAICDFVSLARQLFRLIAELDKQGLLVSHVVSGINLRQKTQWNIKTRIKDWKASRWASRKYTDAKETLQAAKVITRLGLNKPKSF